MAKRRKLDDWQLCMSFDAESQTAVVEPVDLPGTDDVVPEPEPEPVYAEGYVTETVISDDLAAVIADLDPDLVDADNERMFAEAEARAAAEIPLEEPEAELLPPIVPLPPPISLEEGKPPYRVPLMSEVRQLDWNGLNVVSTFSGCGGSCLGYKMAGYKVLWANEFVPAAQETYRANHDGTHLDSSDIRLVTAAKIREVIGDAEIDVLEGSPPCASFSTAGKTSKGWGQVRKYSDLEQRTDDLFEQYIRLVDELRPRAFVAENVAGMVKGVAIGFFNEYLAKMKKLPYNVEARLLDAQYLGVPQRRVRLIFVGVRQDVGKPRFPRKWSYRYSVREAIPWISRQGDNGGFGQGAMQDAVVPSPTIGASPETGNGLFPPSIVEAFISEADYGETTDGLGRRRSLDEPIGAIRATGEPPTIVTPRVIYYEGFEGTPPRDVTDGPAPTVKVGGDKSICSTHFIVEGAGPADEQTKINRKDFSNIEIRRIKPGEFVGENVAASLEGYAVGTEYDKLKPGESSDKYLNLVRAHPDFPSPTVTASGATISGIGAPGGVACVTHPFERRKFTIAELRRICGFPDDFILTGTYAQQWERLGRAVPPPMMRAVAEALIPVLKKS